MKRLALLALAVPLLAAPVAAQDVYMVRSSPAWLGISYEMRWVQATGSCTPQVLVEAVVQGSPAERAGLRAGDAIIAVDGTPVPPGRLQALASRLVPGDSLRLRFTRGGASHEVVAVADRRPDRPLEVYLDPTPSYRGSAPIIEVDGDTLIALNVSADWDPGRARSYWIRHSDGRTEYRTLNTWSRNDLDQRVAGLLECADSTGFRGQFWTETPTTRVQLQRLQERADSLRVVINERALQRGDLHTDMISADSLQGLITRWRNDAPNGDLVRAWRSTPDGVMQIFRGPQGSYTFRVEDHVAVGMRSIAGAELTKLEPELAEYFRNADEGLLVLRIAPDTPAERAGLRPGDVILSADSRTVESVDELRAILSMPTSQPVELRVVRKGRIRDLTLRRD